MADKTAIEWTDATWTPICARRTAITGDRRTTTFVGWHCEHVTRECEFCYAEVLNKRLGTGLPFKPGHRKDIELFLDEKMLLVPLRWKKPRRIFVCSMTDLFADFVKDEWIDRMFAVMALCSQHTFQVLTKRPERMRDYFSEMGVRANRIHGAIWILLGTPAGSKIKHDGKWRCQVPLPNVWLGTSCGDQAAADARIPHLLATPAAIRFLSCEPMLRPINLTDAINVQSGELWNFLKGWRAENVGPDEDGGAMFLGPGDEDLGYRGPQQGPGIDWVICGGESGPHARPMHPDWARSLRDQCAAAGVSFHFKQWGEWKEAGHDEDGPAVHEVEIGTEEAEAFKAIAHRPGFVTADGRFFGREKDIPADTPARLMDRMGKKRAGRLLDGIEHNGFPA